jgi:RNA polymerase sigma-70 factor (ECF subfamily)
MTNKEIIESILNNDEKVIESLYDEYRSHFISWALLEYKIKNEDAKDLFQEAMIVFVMKVQSEKIIEITTTLKTFLFGIGKQLIRNSIKLKYNRESRHQQYYLNHDEFDQIVVDEEDYGIVIAELSCMKTPCKSILQHYYLDNLNLKEIALSLGYKSAQSVKVQKYRCLKTLKDNIFKIKVK